MKFGFWTDLATLQLDDSGSTSVWIQAMPLGNYTHPVYGDIEITPKRVARFADNVNNGIRGQDLDIDYDHKANGGEAAGWVKQAEARPDGLWLLVDWTKSAYQKLKEKAYRYFSPEYNDEWTHPKTGEKHKDVLFGGAITNRPFLKDIVPINLSELFKNPGLDPDPSPMPPEGGKRMDPKVLRALIGLSETATDEEVTAKLAELTRKPEPPTPPEPPTKKDLDIQNASIPDLLRQLSDLSGNPGVKALTELVEAQQKQLSSLKEEQQKVMVERMIDSLDSAKYAVPPVVKDRLREILLEAPEGLGKEVFEAYKKTLELGVIDMTERGWQRRGDEKSPTQLFLSEVDSIMADAANKGRKIGYAEASAQAARQNPQLAEQYRQDAYIPTEGR